MMKSDTVLLYPVTQVMSYPSVQCLRAVYANHPYSVSGLLHYQIYCLGIIVLVFK